MSTDYSKKKVAELADLLKTRSLPHTGKKDELIQRLEKYDTEQAAKPSTTTSTTAAADGAEDEIDWEDDAAATDNPASAAAIAAGGLTQPANPTAVPNQIIDTDPSKTSDLTVDPPAPQTTTTTTTSNTKDTTTETPPQKIDYTTGLASTTLDTELAKRKKRAARFGIQESDTEALKALERAKKFGTGDAADKAAVRGLDEALPERSRKRGRGGGGGGEDNPRDGKRSRNRGVVGGRERERSGTPKDGVKKSVVAGRYSEADRVKAEERKRRFG